MCRVIYVLSTNPEEESNISPEMADRNNPGNPRPVPLKWDWTAKPNRGTSNAPNWSGKIISIIEKSENWMLKELHLIQYFHRVSVWVDVRVFNKRRSFQFDQKSQSRLALLVCTMKKYTFCTAPTSRNLNAELSKVWNLNSTVSKAFRF